MHKNIQFNLSGSNIFFCSLDTLENFFRDREAVFKMFPNAESHNRFIVDSLKLAKYEKSQNAG